MFGFVPTLRCSVQSTPKLIAMQPLRLEAFTVYSLVLFYFFFIAGTFQDLRKNYKKRLKSLSFSKAALFKIGLKNLYFIYVLLFAGTFQGQWLRGLRHGYGVRTSAPFGMASHNKLSETRMASMSSLSQEVDAANVAATASAAAAALGTIHILRK